MAEMTRVVEGRRPTDVGRALGLRCRGHSERAKPGTSALAAAALAASVLGITPLGISVVGTTLMGVTASLLFTRPAAAQGAAPSDEGRLARICRYLEEGSVHQVAAARRQLWEEIDTNDLEALRAILARGGLPRAGRTLRQRLDALLAQRLARVEDQIALLEDARRQIQDLQDELSRPSEAPTTDDPAAEVERRAQAERSLAELRRTRNTTRAEVRADALFLQAQELALAPVLSQRMRGGGSSSDLVLRFHADLHERLVELARARHPQAPDASSLDTFEQRSLVPLVEDLHAADPRGWERFRERAAAQAIELLASHTPDGQRDGLALALDLGEWGVARLERWTENEDSPVPVQLRRLYCEWNRLAVPIELAERTGLALASYRSLSPTAREEYLARLEWVGGAAAVPVLSRILGLEPELSLQVQAAVALARLSDPRGAEFLRRLGLEAAVALEGISRRVLLIEAIHRREQGDLEGALQDLQQLLRRFGEDQRVHYELAFTALQARQLVLAIQHFRRAIELDASDPYAHYNLACALALHRQVEAALEALEQAVSHGFRDGAHLAQDPDLENLRDAPRFRTLLDRLGVARP